MLEKQDEELSRPQSIDPPKRNWAEEALRESQERLQFLINTIPVVIYSCAPTPPYNATFVSPMITAMLGYVPQDFITEPEFWASRIHPDDAPQLLAELLRILETDRHTYEYRFLHKDGSYRWIRDEVNVARDADGQLCELIGAMHDVTELKRMEVAIRESERYNRNLFESSPLGLALCRMDGKLVDVNAAYARIIGRTVAETLSLTYWEITPKQYLAQEQTQLASLQETGKYGPYEKEYLHKDGHLVPVSLTGVQLEKEGEPYIWSVVEDITERKRLEQQLLRSQKLEAIGQLAGGVAHDFNNLLTGIIGNAELLLAPLDPVSPQYARLNTIRSTGERAARIANQLLAIGRKQLVQPETLNLNEVIRHMAELLPDIIGEQIQLSLQLDPTTGWLKADPGQLDQIVLNLAINARDAMLSGGTLTLETRNSNDQVRLAVRDTGQGMSQVVQARIYEPFFTTKALGQGTGLGLAIVHGLVMQNGGSIAVESAPGQGTTFVLTFPRVEGNASPTALETNQEGTQTILVVDDHIVVRDLLRSILMMQGYQVLVAAHGTEALQMAMAYQGPIHLLLTDLMLPGMNGRELAEKITAQRPEIPVLLMSGHTEDELVRRGVAIRAVKFLAKPFTLEAVRRAVNEALKSAVTQAPS